MFPTAYKLKSTCFTRICKSLESPPPSPLSYIGLAAGTSCLFLFFAAEYSTIACLRFPHLLTQHLAIPSSLPYNAWPFSISTYFWAIEATVP